MAEWVPLNIPSFPQELTEVLQKAREMVESFEESLSLLRPPVETLLTFLNEDVNPALVLLEKIVGEVRKILEDFGNSSVYWLLLHPWVGDLGKVGQINPYLLELPSNDFLTHLSASFNDLGDLQRPTGSGTLYALAVGATHPTGFVAALRALGTLLDLQEFLGLANRVESIEALDLEERPPPALPSNPPDWHNAGRLHTLIPPLGALLSSADSVLESFQVDLMSAQSALANFETLLNKKLKQLQEAEEALQALQESLSQDFANVYLLEVQGDLRSGFDGATGFPMHFKYTAGVLLANTTADLNGLKLLLKGL